MTFQKGHPRLGGRKRGTPNKIAKTTKEALDEAGQIVGGKEGKVGVFIKVAEKDIVAFGHMMVRTIPTEVRAEINDITPVDVYIVAVPSGHSRGPDGMLRPTAESEALWKANGEPPPAIVYDEPRDAFANNDDTKTIDADYVEQEDDRRPQLDDPEPTPPAKPEPKRDAQGVVIVDTSLRKRRQRKYGLFGDW